MSLNVWSKCASLFDICQHHIFAELVLWRTAGDLDPDFNEISTDTGYDDERLSDEDIETCDFLTHFILDFQRFLEIPG